MHNFRPGELVNLVVASEAKNSSYVCVSIKGRQTLVHVFCDEMLTGVVVGITSLDDLNEATRTSLYNALRSQYIRDEASKLGKHRQVEVILITSRRSKYNISIYSHFVGSLVFTVDDERFVRPRLVDVS